MIFNDEDPTDKYRGAKRPKTELQKQRMSVAKKGRKYSEEHRHNMSEAHKFRQALKKKIESKHPDLSETEVWKQVKDVMDNI